MRASKGESCEPPPALDSRSRGKAKSFVVGNIIDLEGSEASLRVETAERDWCQVTLEVGGCIRVLGAESRRVVLELRANALRDGHPTVLDRETRDSAWRWVLSLFEDHCSL